MTNARITDAEGTRGPTWSLDRAKYTDIHQRVTVGGTTKLQQCRHYIIIRSRTLFGVTSIRPENRTTRGSFSLFTGPETSVTFGWIGNNRKFKCTDDDIVVVDKKTGEAKHTQVWEHYSKWADVEDSDFGTTEDADA